MQNSNTINEMRDALFNQMRRLSDPGCNLDKEVLRAGALVDVCDSLISSTKVEIEYMKVTGIGSSEFIPELKPIEGKKQKQLTNGSH